MEENASKVALFCNRTASYHARRGMVSTSGSAKSEPPGPPWTLGTAWWRLCLSFHHDTEKPCAKLPNINPKPLFGRGSDHKPKDH